MLAPRVRTVQPAVLDRAAGFTQTEGMHGGRFGLAAGPPAEGTAKACDQGRPPMGWAFGAGRPEGCRVMKKLFSLTPRLVIVAVVGCFVGGLFMLAFASVSMVQLIYTSAAAGQVQPKDVKLVLVKFIGLIDVFLVVPAFFLIGLGLYQLCFSRVELPDWLHIKSLDDLKNKVLKIVVLVLAVQFLGEAVEWSRGVDILYYGAAVALVIAAVSWFLSAREPKLSGAETPQGD